MRADEERERLEVVKELEKEGHAFATASIDGSTVLLKDMGICSVCSQIRMTETECLGISHD